MESMTDEEFVNKLEYEGMEYAFQQYGLGVKDLHPDSPLRKCVAQCERDAEHFTYSLKDLQDKIAELGLDQDEDE